MFQQILFFQNIQFREYYSLFPSFKSSSWGGLFYTFVLFIHTSHLVYFFSHMFSSFNHDWN